MSEDVSCKYCCNYCDVCSGTGINMRRARDPDANGNIDIVVKSNSDVGDYPQTTDVKTLTVLFLSLILDLLGFTVILPLFPTILDYYGQHDDQVN